MSPILTSPPSSPSIHRGLDRLPEHGLRGDGEARCEAGGDEAAPVDPDIGHQAVEMVVVQVPAGIFHGLLVTSGSRLVLYKGSHLNPILFVLFRECSA